MKRPLTVIRAAILSAFVATVHFALAENKPPDIVFIIVDDLNDWLGCLGGLGWTGWPALLNSHRRPSLKDPIAASPCAAHCNPWTKWQSQCSAKHPLPPIKKTVRPPKLEHELGL